MKLNLQNMTCINENINLEEYIEFREYVKKHMEYPEWLGDFSIEDLEHILANGSKIWLYYLDDTPVCSMMAIPADATTINKYEVNLDHKNIIDYGPMMVNPKFIGNGLQYQMLKELDTYSINNNYKYAISTVHPDNTYSINNFIKDNFKFLNQKNFKRGLRNIYIKNLSNETVIQ